MAAAAGAPGALGRHSAVRLREHRRPRPCSATCATPSRARAASSPSTAPRRCSLADRSPTPCARRLQQHAAADHRRPARLPDRGDPTGLESVARRSDHPRSLIQMATGAGKTFTACTFSYRLLKHAGARRILFLVDRNNLGDQTLQRVPGLRPPDDRPPVHRDSTTSSTCRPTASTRTPRSSSPPSSASTRCCAARSWTRRPRRARPSRPAHDDGDRAPGRLQPGDPDRDLRLHRHRRVPPLDLRPVAAGAGVFRRLHHRPHRHALAAHARLLQPATWSPSTPTSARSSTASTSASRSTASAPQVSEQGGTVDAGYDVPVRDRRTRAKRYEELDAGPRLHAAASSTARSPCPNQIRTVLRGLPRQAVHRAVPRPRRRCRRP